MKKYLVLSAIVLAFGVAHAQDNVAPAEPTAPAATEAPASDAAMAPAKKTHKKHEAKAKKGHKKHKPADASQTPAN